MKAEAVMVAAGRSHVINSTHTSLVHAFYVCYSTMQHMHMYIGKSLVNKDHFMVILWFVIIPILKIHLNSIIWWQLGNEEND